MLHLLCLADDAIGNRGLLACQLEELGVFTLAFAHRFLELLRLADNLLARIAWIELREHGIPRLSYIVPLHPQLLYTKEVAGVVLYEV